MKASFSLKPFAYVSADKHTDKKPDVWPVVVYTQNVLACHCNWHHLYTY